MNSPHSWPATRKLFPFDDIIMLSQRFEIWRSRQTSCFVNRSPSDSQASDGWVLLDYIYWSLNRSPSDSQASDGWVLLHYIYWSLLQYRWKRGNDMYKQLDILTHYISWWRHQMESFPRYWPIVRGIHRSPHKGQWHWALIFFWSAPERTVE